MGKMGDNLMQAMIDQAEKDLLHTYNRYQIVLDRGEGMYLYDVNNKKYLDFMSGIAVFALGYGNNAYNDALKAQIDKILHTSNYFYNEPAIKAAARMKKVSGMDRIFFTNSGAEAVEGALKAAMKHAFLKDGGTNHQVIAMENSFHGRTYGALSVTGNPHYREAFGQMPCDVQFARLNDLESVKALYNDKTCAVIVEPVQGEGGLMPASKEFLKGLRNFCDKKNILLIFDEIQCGMGRTGSMFAWQRFGIRPDIMTCAKALGCGVPVGAFLMTEEVGQSSLVAGDHGTTYGGNPFACAAINAVLDQYEALDLVNHVKETAPFLTDVLDNLAAQSDSIIEHRGIGFMQGLVFNCPVGPIIKDAMDHGLILINAGPNIIRFVPALVTEKKHIDEMAQILSAAIERCTE